MKKRSAGTLPPFSPVPILPSITVRREVPERRSGSAPYTLYSWVNIVLVLQTVIRGRRSVLRFCRDLPIQATTDIFEGHVSAKLKFIGKFCVSTTSILTPVN